jgi:hypothetical protein
MKKNEEKTTVIACGTIYNYDVFKIFKAFVAEM